MRMLVVVLLGVGVAKAQPLQRLAKLQMGANRHSLSEWLDLDSLPRTGQKVLPWNLNTCPGRLLLFMVDGRLRRWQLEVVWLNPTEAEYEQMVECLYAAEAELLPVLGEANTRNDVQAWQPPPHEGQQTFAAHWARHSLSARHEKQHTDFVLRVLFMPR